MPMLKRLHLPRTKLSVSRLCLGAGSFGTQVRGDAVRRLVAEFLEAGGDFFDTAHVYAFWEPEGLGASEHELGACLRDMRCRDRVSIMTKGGHPDAGPDYRRPDAYLSPEVISSDIGESLERLGTGRIDLYLLHRDDTRVPVGEIVETLNQELWGSRIRHFGVSNWSKERIAAANEYARVKGLTGIVASQMLWSLADPNWKPEPDPTMRFVDNDAAAWYAENNLPVIAYSATANGYFAGREPSQFVSPGNEARRARARELATTLKCTPTQIALAYLWHQDAPVVNLFSTSEREHLREAVAADSIRLTPGQVQWLRDGVNPA